MSATEQMRAMLDGLMGTARDGSDSQRQHLHFTDNKVCRAFLLDCCPHDIFASTKLELGECSKVHDPALRADYILANKSEDYFYELSALERLQAFVNDADKKTDYLKRKLAETQEELTAEETNKLNRVHELTEKLGKKLAQVDKAEADQDFDLKQKLLDESEKIKKERHIAEQEYRSVSRPASSHQQQNLRVCDICSAYLGINDNDSRLADHFGGKLHLGFITVREKLEDLKKICSEKKKELSFPSSRRLGATHSDRSSNRDRNLNRERERDFDNYENYEGRNNVGADYYAHRDTYDHRRSNNNDTRYRDRDRDRDRHYDRDSRYRDRTRDRSSRDRSSRYRDSRDRERDRSRSSSRYYRESTKDHSRPPPQKDHIHRSYREDRGDRIERSSPSVATSIPERPDSIFKAKTGPFIDNAYQQERENTYQRRLREWEKREADKARKYAIRQSEEKERKILEEQESRKLKEFLEDYKDDRDDIRFYRGSSLARRLADRRKEIEQDELDRQKEKMELEILSRSCAVENSSPQAIEYNNQHMPNQIVGNGSTNTTSSTLQNTTAISNGDTSQLHDHNPTNNQTESLNRSSATAATATSTKLITTNNNGQSAGTANNTGANSKSVTSEEKRKQVEELIGSIPTDKDQLFARKLDWSLLDDNLMEKRIRPWVTKKVAEYMGEKEADLIDFVCGQLTAHTEGAKVLREVAVVLDDEAEKFVVHMWRLLIFELEAKKIGLRK